MVTWSGTIKKPWKNNQILVFGSNTQGRHGKGLALIAYQYWGAVYGQATGICGNSYAIVTKDLTKSHHPSVEKQAIVYQIKELYKYARMNPDKEFIIGYKGTGKNLNGYSPRDMAQMFLYKPTPNNIVFETEFALLMEVL